MGRGVGKWEGGSRDVLLPYIGRVKKVGGLNTMSRVLIFIIANALLNYLLNIIIYMEVEIFNINFFNILI